MGHVILLGDSIFDNAAYVPDRRPVVEQVRRALPPGWRASLLAVDGHMTENVARQLARLPADATHLFVSAGGNDALVNGSILREAVSNIAEALARLQEVRDCFRADYRAMLRALLATGRPAAVCTVYDEVPGLGPAERAALAGFNEVILADAFRAALPVIDLRLACDQPADYSHVSPIEPSVNGGLKIARLIAEVATGHDFGLKRSVIYA